MDLVNPRRVCWRLRTLDLIRDSPSHLVHDVSVFVTHPLGLCY